MNVFMYPRAEISLFFCHKRAKIEPVFQISMSQAVSPDLEPSPDLTSPPTGPLQQETDSCQDVPATLETPESPIPPESTGEASTVDTCTGGTAEATHQTEMETPAELQEVDCDQPVSLDPESTEDVEVRNANNKSLSCFWFAQSS